MIPPVPKLSGLTAQQQLEAWRQWRMAVQSSGSKLDAMTPEQAAFFNGPNPRPNDPRFLYQNGGSYSDAFSPDTLDLFINDKTHYDVNSGNVVKNKGFWDLPESYAILAAAGGLGGVAVAPAIAGHLAAAKGAAAASGGFGSKLASAFTNPYTLGGIISTTGGLIGAKMQSNAASNQAEAQAAAAKYAADLQDAANKRAEAFARQQAENQFQNTEATRRGNYDQWRAREQRVSNLGQALGLNARDIPGYVPGVDPRYTSDAGATPAGDPTIPPGYVKGSPQMDNIPEGAVFTKQGWYVPGARLPDGSGSSADTTALTQQFGSDPVSQALLKYYAARGVTPTGSGTGPTDLAYFRQRINQTGGLTPDNVSYWFGANNSGGRIGQELAGSVPPEQSNNASSASGRTLLPVSQWSSNWAPLGTLGYFARSY